MDIVKKNLVSIIFGVIALLAIAAIFIYPIPGMMDDLRQDLKTSLSTGSQMDALLHPRQPRLLPHTSADSDTDQPLTQFPTKLWIDAGIAATSKIDEQSKDMMKVALLANSRHVPLVPGCLPKPSYTEKSAFTLEYVKETTDFARWRQKLNAGKSPVQAEIDAKKEQLKQDILNRVTDAESKQEADVEIAEKEMLVKPNMEQDRARNMMVYLNPDALSIDPTIVIGRQQEPPSAGRIWDAQLAIWVIDDVTDAVRRANDLYCDGAVPGGAPVKDVLHAPIKQIEKIDNPVFIKSDDAAALTTGVNSPVALSPAVSAMGHVSNALYDVYQFDVVLEVDAAKVPQILRELEVNQFITVLNLQVSSVDTAMAAYNGFIYGDKPVVRLEIQCEELMLHQWTDNLIPESRKNGATDTPGTGGPMGPGAFPGGGPMMPRRPNDPRFRPN